MALPIHPPSLAKALPTLGHATLEWWVAGLGIIQAIEKTQSTYGEVYPLLKRALETCAMPIEPLTAAGASLQLEIAWEDERWEIAGSSAPGFQILCWLLHLPALREQWHRRVRLHRLELLRAHTPLVWLADDAMALPAGAVIAGTESRSWAELAQRPGVQALPGGWLMRALPRVQMSTASYQRVAAGRVEMV